jgi:hypothetical protein
MFGIFLPKLDERGEYIAKTALEEAGLGLSLRSGEAGEAAAPETAHAALVDGAARHSA